MWLDVSEFNKTDVIRVKPNSSYAFDYIKECFGDENYSEYKQWINEKDCIINISIRSVDDPFKYFIEQIIKN